MRYCNKELKNKILVLSDRILCDIKELQDLYALHSDKDLPYGKSANYSLNWAAYQINPIYNSVCRLLKKRK